jgi:hypothetical protein
MLSSAEHSAQEVFSAALAQVAGEDCGSICRTLQKIGKQGGGRLILDENLLSRQNHCRRSVVGTEEQIAKRAAQ